MRQSQDLKILVVEDSAQDAVLIRTAVERAGVRASLDIVEDGVEAVQFLRGEGYTERCQNASDGWIPVLALGAQLS